MDKRWICILIILIIGAICAYLVVDSSNSVGSANVNVNTFTITLPSEFNIDTKSGQELTLINRQTQEKIQVTDLGKGNSTKSNLTEKIDALNNNTNVTYIENTTLTIGNETYHSIYYEKAPDFVNRIVYVNKFGHLFSIECYNFHDNGTIENNIEYIINSMKPDYKQKQD